METPEQKVIRNGATHFKLAPNQMSVSLYYKKTDNKWWFWSDDKWKPSTSSSVLLNITTYPLENKMASGCIPKQSERLTALDFAKNKLTEAIEILDKITDPDLEPRAIEEATSLITEALGKRAGDFIDHLTPHGLTDLVEHYFS